MRTELQQQAEALTVALARWAERDDSKAQPEVRQAANVAVDTIDAMSRALYELRSQLIGEIRRSDDASMVRSARLLAAIRAECDR